MIKFPQSTANLFTVVSLDVIWSLKVSFLSNTRPMCFFGTTLYRVTTKYNVWMAGLCGFVRKQHFLSLFRRF